MNLSAQGLSLIKSFEGFRSGAYKDANGLWACGYGHTSGVTIDTMCDEPTAEQWLAADSDWAQDAVNRHVTVPMSQNQFDALVSFTYNVGAMAFIGSLLLKLMNQGLSEEAADQFGVWNHIDGVVVAGLSSRREAEETLFQGIA